MNSLWQRSRIAVAELERIAEQNEGLLSPAAVVEASRSEDSIFHPYFKWGQEDELVEKARLAIAGQIIRRFRIEVEGPNHTIVKLPRFTSLPQDRHPGGGYRLTVQVMDDPERMKEMRFQAMRELQSFRRKYHAIHDFAELMGLIDKVMSNAAA